MRAVLDSFDGVAFDNLAWGSHWDVDPRDVAAPTLLLVRRVGQAVPSRPRTLVRRPDPALRARAILPGTAHLDVIDGQWPAVLTGLLAIWD